jgi:hypothetical protein
MAATRFRWSPAICRRAKGAQMRRSFGIAHTVWSQIGPKFFVVDVVIAADFGDGPFDLSADEREGGGVVGGNG